MGPISHSLKVYTCKEANCGFTVVEKGTQVYIRRNRYESFESSPYYCTRCGEFFLPITLRWNILDEFNSSMGYVNEEIPICPNCEFKEYRNSFGVRNIHLASLSEKERKVLQKKLFF